VSSVHYNPPKGGRSAALRRPHRAHAMSAHPCPNCAHLAEQLITLDRRARTAEATLRELDTEGGLPQLVAIWRTRATRLEQTVHKLTLERDRRQENQR